MKLSLKVLRLFPAGGTRRQAVLGNPPAILSRRARPSQDFTIRTHRFATAQRRPEIASADCDLTTPIPSSTNNPGTQSRWYVRSPIASSVSAVAQSPPPTDGAIAIHNPRRPREHHSNNVSRLQVRYAATEIESAKSARARGSYLRVSFKNTRETAQAINGWKVTRALQYLENVKGHAEAVPMRRYAGSTGRTAQGT